jgi:hypothetical protein
MYTVMQQKKTTALTSSTTTTTTSLTAVPARVPPLDLDVLTTSETAGARALNWRAPAYHQFNIVTFMCRPHSRLQDGCSMLRQRVRRLPKARLFIRVSRAGQVLVPSLPQRSRGVSRGPKMHPPDIPLTRPIRCERGKCSQLCKPSAVTTFRFDNLDYYAALCLKGLSD